ncbi:polyprenyl synthetase family protein [Candidatus Daviesbacteria bacterium]|nr:polyprenyl synthetase family protein [Candidatus Daviesbacteria bacterium]
MDFKIFSQKTVEHIDKELKRLLKEWRNGVGKTSGSLLPLVDKFIKACKGGKRIRGTLVVLGYEIAKESSAISYQQSDKDKKSLKADSEATPKAGEAILTAESSIIKIAAAYEIFHAAILAHDDIIDQSPKRRGQPSLYKRVGVEQAITLADAGFFLAIKIITESNFEDKLKNQALRFFSQTMLDTAIGQMLDVAHADPKLTAKLKTARYTISGPLKLGAILAGAGPTSPRLRGIKEFGENAGIAFQIRDDILDGEVESVDKAEAKALKYAFRAKRVIPKITSDAKMRKLFSEMVQYMVEREK